MKKTKMVFLLLVLMRICLFFLTHWALLPQAEAIHWPSCNAWGKSCYTHMPQSLLATVSSCKEEKKNAITSPLKEGTIVVIVATEMIFVVGVNLRWRAGRTSTPAHRERRSPGRLSASSVWRLTEPLGRGPAHAHTQMLQSAPHYVTNETQRINTSTFQAAKPHRKSAVLI